MRNCISEETLQAWFDGELAANEAGTVATHLNGCLECAEVARMVEAENHILSKGLAPEFGGTIPTERLRQRIGTAIAALHRASRPTVSQRPLQALLGFFASFRPLAYASIVAAIVIAGVVIFVSLKKGSAPIAPQVVRNDSGGTPGGTASPPPAPPSERPPSLVPGNRKGPRSKASRRSRQSEPDAMSLAWQQRQYDYAIAKLNEAIKLQPAMSPALQVEYAYDMALIDNAIATGREAARRKPKDPQATQSMLAAYQSKVDLMNQVAIARGLEK